MAHTPTKAFLVLAVLAAGLAVPAVGQDRRLLRRGFYRGQEITFQVIDGWAVVEGDVILGRADDLDGASQGRGASQPHKEGAFTSLPARLWPNGVVPYVIDPDLPTPSRITSAVEYYAANTPVRYQPRNGEANYVHFVRTTRGDGVCYSSIGMVGGEQLIRTEDTCTTPTLIHEMGHTIGFFHEQTRKDRNRYVTVLFEHIDKTQFGEYPIGSTTEQDLGFYDFSSVMQYTAFSFSRDGRPTMQTVPAGIPLSESDTFTPCDLDAIQRMYGTPPSSVTITSIPTGLQVKVDGVTVTTPQAFPWAPGSTHTLEAPGPQIAGSLRYQFGIWSDAGAQSHTVTASSSVTVYAASFVRQVRVSVSVTPAGSGSVTLDPPSEDGYYAANTDIRLTAVPSPGYAFQRWFTATGQTCPFRISTNPLLIDPTTAGIGCAAMFTQSAMMTIASDPPGRTLTIDGTSYFAPVNMVWAAGSSHTIAASTPTASSTANVRYVFSGWSDGGAASHSISAVLGSTVTANFKTQYEFTVVAPAPTAGTITLDPPSDGYYDSGTAVRVTFTPAAGFALLGWTGDLSGSANPQTVIVSEQRNVGVAIVRTPAPVLAAVNAATFSGAARAPGELITLFGGAIGPPALAPLQLDASGRVATSLATTRVLFDGIAAPMVYASVNQTSAIVPYAVAGTSFTSVVVEYQGQRTGPVSFAVTDSQPGLFTVLANGQGQAAAINLDGSLNSPASPAPRGSIVSFYATGEGQTSPAGVDGKLAATPLSAPLLPVSVRIGGKPAEVLYAGGAPGLVAGVMQVNARIPADLLPGTHSVYLVVGNAASPLGVTMEVK